MEKVWSLFIFRAEQNFDEKSFKCLNIKPDSRWLTNPVCVLTCEDVPGASPPPLTSMPSTESWNLINYNYSQDEQLWYFLYQYECEQECLAVRGIPHPHPSLIVLVSSGPRVGVTDFLSGPSPYKERGEPPSWLVFPTRRGGPSWPVPVHHGTGTAPSQTWTDRHDWKHYLPSYYGKNYPKASNACH